MVSYSIGEMNVSRTGEIEGKMVTTFCEDTVAGINAVIKKTNKRSGIW